MACHTTYILELELERRPALKVMLLRQQQIQRQIKHMAISTAHRDWYHLSLRLSHHASCVWRCCILSSECPLTSSTLEGCGRGLQINFHTCTQTLTEKHTVLYGERRGGECGGLSRSFPSRCTTPSKTFKSFKKKRN